VYGHAVYDTMRIVYHDDGSAERFFVRPYRGDDGA